MSKTTRMVSIDSSTNKTGMALYINGELNDYGLIDLSSSSLDIEPRIFEMGGKMLKALNIWKPEVVYIEQPQGHGRNVSMVRKLSELIGFAKAWAYLNDAYIEEVPPSVWRKYLGIEQGRKTRNELKEASINAVKDIYGINVIDDIADAINIGSAMLIKYGE